MKLKLIGADSKNGIKILKSIKKVERELDYKIDVDKISCLDKSKYNVRVVPTLTLDNKILCEGSVISDRELKNFIKLLAN